MHHIINFYNLPYVISREIIKYQDFKVIKELAYTNKIYFKLCKDDYFWKMKINFDFGENFINNDINNLKQYEKLYNEVIISECKFLTPNKYKNIINGDEIEVDSCFICFPDLVLRDAFFYNRKYNNILIDACIRLFGKNIIIPEKQLYYKNLMKN